VLHDLADVVEPEDVGVLDTFGQTALSAPPHQTDGCQKSSLAVSWLGCQ
jgi:hypothetical protein